MKNLLLCTTAVASMVTILVADPAAAQSTAQEEQAGETAPPLPTPGPQTSTIVPVDAESTESAQAPPARQSAQAGGLEEIVVTAQRRSESLQDVPIAISAVTAASVERQGIIGTEGLGVAVPTLQFSRQSGLGGAPFLRGVGSAQATVNNESPVAVYVDDVYYGAPASTLMSFNNIESVEVLKGPQGTLFGRNATGGVVHVHTKRPSHETAVDATIGYASYDTIYGNAYVTGGLTDTIAANLAFTGRKQHEGYGFSATTGEDIYKAWNWAVRGQLLWEPGATTSVLIAGDYGKSNGDIGQNVILFPGTVGVGGGTNVGRFTSFANPLDSSPSKRWGLSARVEQELGDLTLRSVSAYRKNDSRFLLDSDGGGLNTPVIVATDATLDSETFSQELQLLSGQDGPFKWILGAFYYYSDAAYDPIVTSGLAFAPLGGRQFIYGEQILNSYSGFGEATYEFLPDTNITLGIRYTDDQYSSDLLVTDAVGNPLPPTPTSREASFDKVTYRAILDTKVTPDILAYGSYSRGFKSGGFNLSAPRYILNGVPTDAPIIEPEVLDAYEIGLKTELFDRLLRLNVAAFIYDYSNLQVGVVQQGTVLTLNAASARVKGIDLDYTFVPTDRLTISGGLGYLDSKYKSFPNGPFFVPNPANCDTLTTTGPLTGGNSTCLADLSGNRTSRAPELTLSTAINYTIPASFGDFNLGATWYHSSEFFWEPDNRLAQPTYDLVGASVGFTTLDGKYTVRVYGKNLLDEFYYSYVSASTTRDSYSPEMPRNFGVELTAHF